MHDLALFQDLDEEIASSRPAINDILVDVALVNELALSNLTLAAILSVTSSPQYYESNANSAGMLTVFSNLLQGVVLKTLPDSLHPQLFNALKQVSFSR